MRCVALVVFIGITVCCATSPRPSWATSAPTCTLSIKLIDSASHDSLPGLVQLRRADGSLIELPGLINHGHGVGRKSALHNWWAIVKETAVEVPQEKISIRAISGLETEETRTDLDLTDKSSANVQVPLVRFYNARKKGQVAGNTHYHAISLLKKCATGSASADCCQIRLVAKTGGASGTQ